MAAAAGTIGEYSVYDEFVSPVSPSLPPEARGIAGK